MSSIVADPLTSPVVAFNTPENPVNVSPANVGLLPGARLCVEFMVNVDPAAVHTRLAPHLILNGDAYALIRTSEELVN
jgi:hypothetical protein